MNDYFEKELNWCPYTVTAYKSVTRYMPNLNKMEEVLGKSSPVSWTCNLPDAKQ
jgi:hypothetical protein